MKKKRNVYPWTHKKYPIEGAIADFIDKAGKYFFPKKVTMSHALELIAWMIFTLSIFFRIYGR